MLEGRAVGDFQLRSGISTKGKPYQLVVGKVVSGQTFVNITQSVPQGEQPILPADGEEVRACVVPNFKDDGLLNLDVHILRPDVAALVTAKK